MELNSELVKKYNIKKAIAILEDNDSISKRTETKLFNFNTEGQCIREKQVVSTEDFISTKEDIKSFDDKNNLIKKVSIHIYTPKTEEASFILGYESNDTIIINYIFDINNRLQKETEISNNDTTITNYRYEALRLIKSNTYTSSNKNHYKLKNNTTDYFYDDLGRLSKANRISQKTGSLLITKYKYLNNTDKIVEKIIIKQIRNAQKFPEKKASFNFDTSKNLINVTPYLDLEDMNSYKTIYKYDKNLLLIEKQSFIKSPFTKNSDFLLEKKTKYIYDERGILIEERFIKDKELQYIYKFKYE